MKQFTQVIIQNRETAMIIFNKSVARLYLLLLSL